MNVTVSLTKQEMIEVLEKFYSTQFMTTVNVVLQQENETSNHKKSDLWYPDDSGAWIECDGVGPLHLSLETPVQTLSRVERKERKMYNSSIRCVAGWAWDDIVAYRVYQRISDEFSDTI